MADPAPVPAEAVAAARSALANLPVGTCLWGYELTNAATAVVEAVTPLIAEAERERHADDERGALLVIAILIRKLGATVRVTEDDQLTQRRAVIERWPDFDGTRSYTLRLAERPGEPELVVFGEDDDD